MDRITPTVIAALVIGVIVGYVVNSLLHPNQNTNQNQQAISDTGNPQPSAQLGSKEEKIQNALSAAPATVAKDATVVDFPTEATAGGEMVELRKGTNIWTCLPDYPASPGKDPMCVDKQGMLWMQGYITQTPPNLTQAGLGYMLAGGSDASNTDPFATKPTEGEDWITTPSHLMVFPAGTLDPNIYGTDPKQGGSWIMWANTPYAHLMVPVK